MKKFQRYEFLVYVILFVVFFASNEDKPHCNILNSLGAMIFCVIKLSEIYLRKWIKWRIKDFNVIFFTLQISQNIKKYTANERLDQMQ